MGKLSYILLREKKMIKRKRRRNKIKLNSLNQIIVVNIRMNGISIDQIV